MDAGLEVEGSVCVPVIMNQSNYRVCSYLCDEILPSAIWEGVDDPCIRVITCLAPGRLVNCGRTAISS